MLCRKVLKSCVRTMNTAIDGEEKARQIRRTEGKGQHISNSDSDSTLRLKSDSSRSKQIGVDRNDCEGGAYLSTRRATGKMISQMLAEYREQLATKQKEIERLQIRIQEFEELAKELTESEDKPS